MNDCDLNEFATVRKARMEKFGGVVSVSAESLALMRRYRSLGVVWAIFSLCYNIILWVVITQVRLVLIVMVMIVMMVIIVMMVMMMIKVMMLHHPVDSDHPGEEITTSCPASIG